MNETETDFLPLPIDHFSKNLYKKNFRVNNPETRFFKEYVEAKHGGGNPNKGLEQYVQNDRKVLSFDAVWNDTAFAGDVNRYKINYYLADDTVEVKEFQTINSGKHPFPLMLKKSKLPKKIILVHCPGMSHSKIEHYSFKDLLVGQTILIYGRECLLYDCDMFTREYYEKKLKIMQKPAIRDGNSNNEKTSRIDPPYNGFGSELDSIGNCRHLIPKPPRLDMLKIFKYDCIIFRFICERITGDKNDELSSLILNFYMGDDSLSIYITTKKNSGILGGKFLERKKYKNKLKNNDFFAASDFQIGSILEINNHKMRIISADEFTIKYMSSNVDVFPMLDADKSVSKLVKNKSKFGNSEFDVLMNNLKPDNRIIDFKMLMIEIQKLEMNLEVPELFSVYHLCERNEKGELCVGEFKSKLKQLKTNELK